MPLASLSPFGPIFAKELRVTAHRKRTYLLRVIYLAILLVVLLLAYLVCREMGTGGGVAARTQQLNMMGQMFFSFFSWFSIIAMIAIGPVLTCSAVNSERLGKTLGVLLMTPITSWQIISGKLFSRLLVALTLLGLSLPVLAIVRLLGGVEIEAMFAVICLCVSTVFAAAALGLFFSTVVNRAYAAILLSYAVLLFVYLFLTIVAGMMLAASARQNMGRPPAMSSFMLFMDLTNPTFAVAMVADPRGMGPAGVTIHPWWYCVITHMSAAAILVALSGLILRRQARRVGSEGSAPVLSPMPWPQPFMGPMPTLPMPPPPIASPAPATAQALPPPMPPPLRPANVLSYQQPGIPSFARRKIRTVSDNPVLWREIRRPLLARLWQRLLGGGLFIGMLLVTYILLAAANGLNERGAQIGYAWILHGLLTLGVCVLSASSIAHEKESDTWTLLLAAPMRGSSIVMGKTLGLLRRLAWPMAFITFHFLIFTIAGVISVVAFLVVIWVMITFNSIAISTGVWLSLRLRKVTTAVILNLLVPIFFYIMVPILLAIMGSLVLDRRDSVEAFFVYLPFNYEMVAIDELSPRSSRYDYRDRFAGQTTHIIHVPGLGHITTEEFLAAALGVGVAHLLIAGGILGLTIWRFDSIVGRSHQRAPLWPDARYLAYAPRPILP